MADCQGKIVPNCEKVASFQLGIQSIGSDGLPEPGTIEPIFACGPCAEHFRILNPDAIVEKISEGGESGIAREKEI